MAKKFNRKYREYQPGARDGPPTKRICKRVKCEDDITLPTSPPEPSP